MYINSTCQPHRSTLDGPGLIRPCLLAPNIGQMYPVPYFTTTYPHTIKYILPSIDLKSATPLETSTCFYIRFFCLVILSLSLSLSLLLIFSPPTIPTP